MRTTVTLPVIMCGVVLAFAVGANDGAAGDLRQAISYLSPDGQYLPQLGWGFESGSPADGLVIGEPLASMYFRAALAADDSLLNSSDAAGRRLANLTRAWTEAMASEDYRSALSVLSARVRAQVEQGADGNVAVHRILQTDPHLSCCLMIREPGAGSTCGAPRGNVIVMARKCFDDDYYIANIWPISICKTNGSNCTVEVDCDK